MGEEFAVGSRVSVRGLAWDVLEVTPLGAQTLLRLRCADGDLGGLEWDILHPAEPVEMLRSELRPDAPGPLAAWRLYHQACLLEQVLGPADMLVAEPGRVRIEPYQLVPLMRALELPRPRLLLADGVGLGKTIEAGLIACELIARRRAHRVLVVAPAGPLLVQWAQEMRQRFGLRFTVDHRCRVIAAATAKAGAGRQSVRCDRALPDVAGFRQAGTRAGGTRTFGMGPGDHRRGASLHQHRRVPTARIRSEGGWRR